MKVDPFEIRRVVLTVVQRRLGPVKPVQIAHKQPQTCMRGKLKQRPIQTAVVIPFSPLPELAAHKQELLAWLRVHVRKQQTQARELPPIVAGHARDQGAFAVYNLIVRERQNEVFVKSVDHPEGQLPVMPFAVSRIERQILERVVHPAHIPFETESQSTLKSWF